MGRGKHPGKQSDVSRRRAGAVLDQTAQGQPCNIGYVAIGESPAQFQHCRTPFQKNCAPFGVDASGGGHDRFELGIA